MGNVIYVCRSSLQQHKCIVKSSNDIKHESDPVFDNLLDDLTGMISDIVTP